MGKYNEVDTETIKEEKQGKLTEMGDLSLSKMIVKAKLDNLKIKQEAREVLLHIKEDTNLIELLDYDTTCLFNNSLIVLTDQTSDIEGAKRIIKYLNETRNEVGTEVVKETTPGVLNALAVVVPTATLGYNIKQRKRPTTTVVSTAISVLVGLGLNNVAKRVKKGKEVETEHYEFDDDMDKAMHKVLKMEEKTLETFVIYDFICDLGLENYNILGQIDLDDVDNLDVKLKSVDLIDELKANTKQVKKTLKNIKKIEKQLSKVDLEIVYEDDNFVITKHELEEEIVNLYQNIVKF